MKRLLLILLTLPLFSSAQNVRRFHLGNQPSWSPLYLNTALDCWYDGSDTSTLFTDTAGTTRAVSGNTIALWKDKSGHGYSATQATAASRPTLTSQGLVFNGTSSTLGSTMTLSQFTTTNAGSMFAALKVGASPTAYAGVMDFRVTGGNNTGLILVSTTKIGMDWLTNSLYSWQPATFTSGVLSIAGFVNNAAAQIYSFNGTTATNTVSTTAVGTGQTTVLYIGQDSSGGRFFQGTIYELVATNTALSTSDRQKLEGYLAWKWGSQSLLAAGHPYKNFPP